MARLVLRFFKIALRGAVCKKFRQTRAGVSNADEDEERLDVEFVFGACASQRPGNGGLYPHSGGSREQRRRHWKRTNRLDWPVASDHAKPHRRYDSRFWFSRDRAGCSYQRTAIWRGDWT